MTVIVIDNDVIMLKPLSICRKIQKNIQENAFITCSKCRITTKLAIKVAHDKPIPHAKENSEISTDVKDNDVIMLKFERFRQKTISFKRLDLSSLQMNL